MNELTGKAHKFGDNINTDYIISGRYKFSVTDPDEFARHLLEDMVPGFYSKISKGDFIVAGINFGCGSSREQAPLAIKHAGISLVLAKSFARIFYRNSINVGLPLIECDTERIEPDDKLRINLEEGKIFNLTKNIESSTRPLPKIMLDILKEGGLVNYFKKFGGFKI